MAVTINLPRGTGTNPSAVTTVNLFDGPQQKQKTRWRHRTAGNYILLGEYVSGMGFDSQVPNHSNHNDLFYLFKNKNKNISNLLSKGYPTSFYAVQIKVFFIVSVIWVESDCQVERMQWKLWWSGSSHIHCQYGRHKNCTDDIEFLGVFVFLGLLHGEFTPTDMEG